MCLCVVRDIVCAFACIISYSTGYIQVSFGKLDGPVRTSGALPSAAGQHRSGGGGGGVVGGAGEGREGREGGRGFGGGGRGGGGGGGEVRAAAAGGGVVEDGRGGGGGKGESKKKGKPIARPWGWKGVKDKGKTVILNAAARDRLLRSRGTSASDARDISTCTYIYKCIYACMYIRMHIRIQIGRAHV